MITLAFLEFAVDKNRHSLVCSIIHFHLGKNRSQQIIDKPDYSLEYHPVKGITRQQPKGFFQRQPKRAPDVVGYLHLHFAGNQKRWSLAASGN